MGECDGVGAVHREVAVSRGMYSARVAAQALLGSRGVFPNPPLSDYGRVARRPITIRRLLVFRCDFGGTCQGYWSRSEARSFFKAMAAECDLPQWHIASSNGRREPPKGVMAYTTRGGVSAYTVRSTIPVLCRSRSCWESVRCVIPAIDRFSSENRLVLSKSCSRMAPFQRPPTIRAVVSTGQSSGRLIMLGLVPDYIPCIGCVSRIPMYPCSSILHLS